MDVQQSIAIMNMNLQDIQQDIHRLATQQSQMQAQHLQAQQLMQAQQIANMLNQVSVGTRIVCISHINMKYYSILFVFDSLFVFRFYIFYLLD